MQDMTCGHGVQAGKQHGSFLWLLDTHVEDGLLEFRIEICLDMHGPS